jgi:hypothetical protein
MLATVLPKIMYFLMLIYVGWKIVGFYAHYGKMLEEIT